ncbi:MAG: hypothetical protein V7L01_05205 [Nostoc sp.]|uniref:hypothetical protein n=1 Tax=Nostoc sp. TaxID=1180 RepID=UPI002FF77DA6
MIQKQELTVVASIAVNSSIHGTYQEYQLSYHVRLISCHCDRNSISNAAAHK